MYFAYLILSLWIKEIIQTSQEQDGAGLGRHIVISVGNREPIYKLLPPAHLSMFGNRFQGRLTGTGVETLINASLWMLPKFLPILNGREEAVLHASNTSLNMASAKVIGLVIALCRIKLTNVRKLERNNDPPVDVGTTCSHDSTLRNSVLEFLYPDKTNVSLSSKLKLELGESIQSLHITVEPMHTIGLPLNTCGKLRKQIENFFGDLITQKLNLNCSILNELFRVNGYAGVNSADNSSSNKSASYIPLVQQFISIKELFSYLENEETGEFQRFIKNWPKQVDWSIIFRKFNVISKTKLMQEEEVRQALVGNLMHKIAAADTLQPDSYHIYVVNEIHVTAILASLGMNFTRPDAPGSFLTFHLKDTQQMEVIYHEGTKPLASTTLSLNKFKKSVKSLTSKDFNNICS